MAAATPASADVCPPYQGITQFPDIHSPADPEEYCWEVQLGEGQELRQIDDRHAAVYFEDEHIGMTITAEQARDATGKAVPTTLAVTGEDIVTLTVHHREGDPAASGAPFTYPITAGPPFEVGISTATVIFPLGEPLPQTEECTVPDLVGGSLKVARKKLRRAHCRLGVVHGERSRSARIVKQFRKPGKWLPAGTDVGVKLGV